MLEEDCLVLSVLKGDVQTCLSLLCEGVDPNTVSAAGAPVLHLALSSGEESQAVALVQLLLVHGADPNPVDTLSGRSAMDLALSSNSSELISLLGAFGESEVLPGEEVVKRFHKYSFQSKTEESLPGLNNNGAKFLQKVADLFEENIKGVRHEVSEEERLEAGDISQVVTELGKIGFRAAAKSFSRSELCSTPCRPKTLPMLEISAVSSINSEDSFYSCSGTVPGNSAIAISEEYVITDRAENISLHESRHSSLLRSAGEGRTLRDISQTLIEPNNLTLTFPSTDSEKYPQPLRSSLSSLVNITGAWPELCGLEQEMCCRFSSLTSSQAELVNQLTRESACKSSFNYLLMDPDITQNLPIKLFQVSDQELWRTYVSSIFYVGKGSRSRPFQHLYEAVKLIKFKSSKKTSDKIK